MIRPTRGIPIYTALRGHAIGVGNPDSLSPETDETSLLCAVTFLPITAHEWSRALKRCIDIRDAVRIVMKSHGGIIVLRPSNLHLSPLARFPVKGAIGEC